MARTSGRAGTVGLVVIVAGVIFAVAGVVTWFVVADQLAAENITVSEDAEFLGGSDVTGPFAAYSQAQVINQHALEATGGKTYAELERDDPARETAMQASFLRSSLFTSVVAFGVAALATVLGILLVLIGWALRDPERGAEVTSSAG
ncbi:MAG TPA: aromatic ring-opening dioxygenase LigA [Ornithinibacter sp.]|nr:aromatic ring-opening dioxygenase LigA [Ornithinibacter sp.]